MAIAWLWYGIGVLLVLGLLLLFYVGIGVALLPMIRHRTDITDKQWSRFPLTWPYWMGHGD